MNWAFPNKPRKQMTGINKAKKPKLLKNGINFLQQVNGSY